MGRDDFTLQSMVSIDDIFLDEKNPRIRSGSNQSDCIEKVLRKEDQMLNLMESIAKDGLSTAQILVSPADTSGKWVVKDGNRRVTALKLLNNPSLCTNEALRIKIAQIVAIHGSNIPSKIDCLSSDKQASIAQELVLRHSGQLNGVGQIGWSSYLRTIYLLNNTLAAEYKRAGQYLLWSENHQIEVDDEFPISTVTRFFTAENIKTLGFEVQGDDLVLTAPVQVAIIMARRVVDDFGTGRVKVQDVFSPDQAMEYLKNVRSDAGWPLPATPSSASSPNPASTPTSAAPTSTATNPTTQTSPTQTTPATNTLPAGAGPTSTPPAAGRPPSKPSWDRKKLFTTASPAPAVLAANLKAKGVLFEISQIKDVRMSPLTVAFLLRALIELSELHYRNANGLTDKRKLADNISAACDSMLTTSKITKSQSDLVKAYTVTTQTDVSIFNIDTLQKYLHRPSHLPSSSTIITFWDELCPFVRACWS